MSEKSSRSARTAQLGRTPEGRIQRYFCIDDDACPALSCVSKEATLVRKRLKRVKVLGKEVDGWIVELRLPATDGVVRKDPLKAARDAPVRPSRGNDGSS